MKTRYPIHVFYSGEDKCYIADIPDLKYCSAHGETPEAALREVLLAQSLMLESLREAHEPMPKPRYRPAVYELVS